MPNVKLTIPVGTLLTNAQATRKQADAAHRAALAEHKKDLGAWEKELAAALRAAAAKPRQLHIDDYYDHSGRGRKATVRLDLRAKPTAPSAPDLTVLDRAIAMLKACTDETVALLRDDPLARFAHAPEPA